MRLPQLFALTCLPIALAAAAAPWSVAGNATFHADGTAFLSIDSSPAPVSGKVELDGGKVTGELVADLTKLKTSDSAIFAKRDEHLHQLYLKTAKYPTATLTLKAQDPAKWCGELQLVADKVPVCGTATVKDEADGSKTVEAHFDVDTDKAPSLGRAKHENVVVSNVINVTVKVKATKAAAAAPAPAPAGGW